MSLPSNVHVSTHPSLQAKLSQLRSASADSAKTKSLIHDISLILACEAFTTAITTKPGPKVYLFPSSCSTPR